jgi:hypothetical protein
MELYQNKNGDTHWPYYDEGGVAVCDCCVEIINRTICDDSLTQLVAYRRFEASSGNVGERIGTPFTIASKLEPHPVVQVVESLRNYLGLPATNRPKRYLASPPIRNRAD